MKRTFVATAAFATYAILFSSSAFADSGRLVIRLINAETGRPLSHQNVLVEWDDDAEESTVFIGGQGRGTMPILIGAANLTVKPGVKEYGDPDRLSYYTCNAAAVSIPLDQAVKHGFVAHNTCTDRVIEAKPGEIVFWARPLPLWKPDFQ